MERRAPAILLIVLLIVSCGTIPKEKTTANWLRVLPEDVSYYLYLNIKSTRGILKNIIRHSPLFSADIERIVDMTEKVYVGVKLKGKGKPDVSLILIGSYPFFIHSAFGWNKEWEEVKGETPYWRHKKDGLEAAAPESYIIILSRGNMAELIASFRAGKGFALSSPVLRDLDANDITLLFPLGLDEKLSGSLGIPVKKKIIEQIWIGGRENKGKFNFSGVFNMAPDVNADSFRKLLQIMILSLLRDSKLPGLGERLNAMAFSVEDRLVKVANFYLTSTEIEILASSLFAGGL